MVGCCYLHGWYSEPKNYDVAVEKLEECAQKGFVKAMNKLGWMYYNGVGVNKDREVSLMWYKKAMELGNGSARNHVVKIQKLMQSKDDFKYTSYYPESIDIWDLFSTDKVRDIDDEIRDIENKIANKSKQPSYKFKRWQFSNGVSIYQQIRHRNIKKHL